MAEGPAGSVLVVIPTYNERDNLEPLVARMHVAVPDADVLVVDDGSPDGTITAATSRFTPDVLVGATPLRTTTTLAGRLRSVPEWVLLATGLAGVGTAVARGRRRGRAEGDEHG